MNPIHLFLKIVNRINRRKNRYWKYLPVDKLSTLGIQRDINKDVVLSRLHQMLGSFDKSLFSDITNEESNAVIEWANHTLEHEFDYLGSGLKVLDPIPWCQDFKTGYAWPQNTFFWNFLPYPPGSDIKVPWELSRGHHLLWLGEAYLMLGENKYAQEIIDQIDNWIDENPLMYTVNWKCAMDVAIRSVNWMYALTFIADYEGLSEPFVRKVYRSLRQHLFFIENDLEKQIPYSNNHYSADIVGILFLRTLFNKRWKRAAKVLYNDIRIQVLPSGVHYERSVSYHRLMVELYGYSVYMLGRMGETLPTDIKTLLQKMFDYVGNYIKPNGMAPLVADNDDGRFLPFVKRDFRNHQYLLSPSSLDNKLVCQGQRVVFNAQPPHSEIYQDAGFAILREGNAYLYVSNGGYSRTVDEKTTEIITHTHNDLLSFEFAVGGKDMVIDPGTYVYNSEKNVRNEFRSTAKHNTIIVDEEEQNTFASKDMFCVVRNVHINRLMAEGEGVKGSYVTIKGGMTHERTFLLENNSVIIKDRLQKKGNGHHAVLFFHLAEGIEYNRDVKIQCSAGTPELVESTWSPSFGVMRPTHAVMIRCSFDELLEVETIIQSYES